MDLAALINKYLQTANYCKDKTKNILYYAAKQTYIRLTIGCFSTPTHIIVLTQRELKGIIDSIYKWGIYTEKSKGVKPMFKVLLPNVTSVSMFVRTCEQFKEDINYRYGRYIIDGKSIMGILSCDLNKPAEVEILTDDPEVINSFEKAIERWTVEE